VKDYLDRAISEGWSRQRFIDNLRPELVKRGWWGRAEVKDPDSGEVVDVQLGSVRRLRTIYDTNLRTAYSAGHWQRIEDNARSAPYVMYSAVLDDRTRPAHRAWNGKVLRADDPWWETHTPPNGWNCRCTVIQLSQRDIERMGKKGPDEAPHSETRQWINPRTGEVLTVPAGVDPGWGYAPGASRRAEALALSREKLEAADPRLAAAAISALVRGEVFGAWLKKPEGTFPIAIMADADAQRIGATVHVVQLSAESAGKQARHHADIAQADYAFIQQAVERGRAFRDGELSMVYVLEDAGYVTVVKATRSGKALFLTSFRRLSGNAVKRDAELRRLLGDEK
jgi:SPP1 gp7 family putative phage head morphogenesis protein